MRIRDFIALMAVCLVWGLNFVIAKFSVTGTPGWVPGFDGAPPIFFAFLRFALLYAVLAPWLRPKPADMPTMFGIAMGMGALQYVLIFLGLQWATPSGMAVALQMGVPFATILSVLMLKERVGLVRVGGILLAFVGITIVVVNPAEMELSIGLLIGLVAALVGAFGMILVKRMPMDSIRMQAWIGLISWPPLLILSLVFEQDQLARVMDGGWIFMATLVFTVVLVNIFGHGVFYSLLQRYDATLIAPLTLMAPLIGVFSGILLTHDPFGWQLILGTILALGGVAVIAMRPNKKMPSAGLAREKTL